ncbi:MAG TPA: DUF455 family protein [Burkholderiales bacterium]|nr:DUF455 family protein [Burkholderiales bacterium]
MNSATHPHAVALTAVAARDSRFTVVESWSECANFPEGDPQREIEFFHRQMNEEIDSLECCAINLREFPNEEWAVRMGLARQCADEARHAAMFRRIFESRGGRVGQYPICNIQYRILANVRTLVGRLAVQNRCFEAGGLDAIKFGIEAAQQRGDHEQVDLYQMQQADEIVHVRFANDWVRAATQKDPRAVLQIGAAMSMASKAYSMMIGPDGSAGTSYPADVDGRKESGFTDSEVRMAMELQLQMGR